MWTGSNLVEKDSISPYSFRLWLIIMGKSRQEFQSVTSHLQLTEINESMPFCLLVLRCFSTLTLFPLPGEWCCPQWLMSVNLIKTHPTPHIHNSNIHAHRPIQSRQSLIKTLCLGDSRLCLTDS